ncbi:hypothetical protein LNKW23_36600 [Paralimibaculum aggregatum]|uniref:Ribonuclease E n=1 Tax=Paralimibaculum aggregatum TaxID=3036245 RepID=A0ABQ6LPN4_9RHOB|nr:ribonuclease E/G [Limibaculum sp. NKW23]GMG84444.1 hypothetical protein LNKW23_36600 [Limibaculum sp. NKW23]
MTKKMLIDATHPEETRVVVVDGTKVEDFDFESINKRQLAGNIYLAKVTRVEPSLQAAFVEYGGNRHGFLAFAEIHPDYYQIPVADREALLAEEERDAQAEAASEDAEADKAQKRGRSRRRTKDSKAKDEAAGDETAEAKPARRSRRKAAEPAAAEGEAGAEGETGEATPAEKKPRSRRRPSRAASTAASAAATPAAGLEVIDLEAAATEAPAESPAATDVPKGLEIADPEAEADPESASVIAHSSGARPRAEDRSASEDAQTEEGAVSPVETAAAPEAEAAGAETAGAPDEGDPAPLDAVVGGDAGETAAPVLAEALAAVPEDASDAAGLPEAPAEVPAAAIAEPAEPEAMTEVEPTPLPEAAEPAAPAAEAGADTAGDAPAEAAADGEDNAGSDEGDDTPAGPRSIAEDSGLEDETLTEEIAPAEAEGEGAAEAPAKPKTRTRSTRGTRTRKSKTADKTAEKTSEKPADKAERADRAERDDDGDSGSDLEIEQAGAEDPREEMIRERTIKRRRYRIQDVIKMRQIMLVQVVKEERGNKGAALTTYLSLAGRYCVLMPNTARGGGISRKITNAPDRKRLREVVGSFEVPKGMGLIVRTAGAERTKPEIKRDYEFLLRQWEQIRELTLKSIAPCLIYEEGSLIKRSIRDIYSKEIEEVLVEGEAGYREAKDYMKMLTPSHAKNVKQYTDTVPLFIRYQVESYLNGMFSPVVQLKSGGYIVIGITEALVAIDVNSGRSTKEGSVEDTALKTNLEAAEEVARQLRLRDLAGLIVIDFIDMDERRNNAAVEKRMKDRLKSDRARIQIGRISGFGLMEMSRQRLRPGMLEASTRPCPACHGQGLIRSDESLSLAILREVEEQGVRDRFREVIVTCPVDIANFLINTKRQHIARIEERHGLKVTVLGDPTLVSPEYKLDRIKGAAREQGAPSGEVITAASVLAPSEPAAAAPQRSEPARARDGGERRDRGERDDRGDRGDRSDRGDRGERADRGDRGERSEERGGEAAERGRETDADGKRRRRGKRGGRRRRGRGEDGAEMQHEDVQRGEAETDSESQAAADSGAGDSGAGDSIAGQSDAADAPEAVTAAEATAAEAISEAVAAEAPAEAEAAEATETKPKSRSTRGQRGRGRKKAAETVAETADEAPAEATASEAPVAEAEAPADAAVAEGADEAEDSARAEPAEAEAVAAPETPAGAEAGATEVAAEAAEAGTEPQPAPASGEGAAAEDDRPKKRGWWSFGF